MKVTLQQLYREDLSSSDNSRLLGSKKEHLVTWNEDLEARQRVNAGRLYISRARSDFASIIVMTTP